MASLLFIFFALPIATILLAIVLQKVLHCPILVAITFFAIYLIVSFALFSSSLAEALIATIIYTVIALITAILTNTISNLLDNLDERNNSSNSNNSNNSNICSTRLGRTGSNAGTNSIRGCCRRF